MQPVRHTDARRLAYSRAGEDNLDTRREGLEEGGDLVGRDSRRSLEGMQRVVGAPDVDQQRAGSDQRVALRGIDPE
jgi:hypothetical protein